MRFILSVTVPVYLLIGLGWLCVRGGLFDKSEMRLLGRFVIGVALPALVFDALSTRGLSEVLHPAYLLAYAGGSLLMLFGGRWYARRVRGLAGAPATLRGLGMSASNSGFVGLPIVQALLGPAAAVGLALNMIVENLLILPLAIALADRGDAPQSRAWPAARQALVGLLRMPLVLAMLAGMVFALLGWRLPEPAARAVGLLARASSPVALFLIGGTLVGLRVGSLASGVARVVGAKLLLHPLAVGGLLWLLAPLLPLEAPLRTAAVLYAAMPMLSIYPVLAQKHHDEDFCAAALLAATVASFFTLSTLIWGLGELPGWLPEVAP